ncbi:kinase-like domain-containing protein [Truncatella angustata]|uniref:Kinase-like domain-containing protein n=1 Tax=Truncatella angustata TaxID=152316 RepID=A0A9P8UW39_9PEZI|nr:kinase-like domain-containing protein [Truncatella angustata]KAH6659427.1 kinase-like domain-containing protein [Truncatella angustata]
MDVNNANIRAPKSAQEIEHDILGVLFPTPFACAKLTALPQGTTNFVFRGTLTEPVPVSSDEDHAVSEKIETVIVKHVEKHTRLNPALRLDSLDGFEPSILSHLRQFRWEESSGSTSSAKSSSGQLGGHVRVPHVLFAGQDTFVVEDFGQDTKDMAAWLLGPEPELRHKAKSVGQWLKAFHRWAIEPSQEKLVARLAENSAMGEFRIDIMYRGISAVCEKLGLLDGDTITAFKEVEALILHEFAERDPGKATGEEWGPIHSDFWTGNVLVPTPEGSGRRPYFSVIDWEFAHLGFRAYDLGHMTGDLIEKHQLGRLDGFTAAFGGFVEGYSNISRDMAFRTLIHAGAQLICWYFRGPKKGLHDDEIRRIIKLGRDMICYGIKRDEYWFRDNGFGPIISTPHVEQQL